MASSLCACASLSALKHECIRLPSDFGGYSPDGGRIRKGWQSLRHRDYFDRSLEIGAGGIYLPAADMLRWNEALNGEKLLNRKSLDLMFTPSTPGNYGFGWFIEKHVRTKAYHEGSDPGFAAFEIRYPEEKTFVIVFANVEDAPVRIIANGLGELLLTGKVPTDLKWL